MRRSWFPLAAVTAALAASLLALPRGGGVLALAFPDTVPAVYPLRGFATLLWRQALLVAIAVSVATVLGAGLGIAVTRPAGRAFRALTETIGAAGQAFPPVAVLALAVPSLGYGERPAIVALALYGLLPVLANTLAALDGLPADILEAADGMGMGPSDRLLRVELPLASPLIVAGIRTAAIVGIGTAAIASTVGVPTLGAPILDGLTGRKTGWVVEGALVAALFAIATDLAFVRLEAALARRFAA